MKLLCLWMVCACASQATPTLEPEPRRLVVLAGQSNGFGTGQVTAITGRPELKVPYPAVTLREQWSIGQPLPDPIVWTTREVPLQDRGTVSGQPAHQFGAELSMMHDLDGALPGQWAVAKMTRGDTSLFHDWKPDGEYPSDVCLFDQLVAFVRASATDLDATLDTVVWMQGETDAEATASSGVYGTNLVTFVATLRERLGPFHFVFSAVTPNANATLPFAPVVRDQQAQAASQISDSVLVPTDDLGISSPPHYDADGLVTLGDRFADVIAKF